MAELKKDVKYVARLILFIPAGFMAYIFTFIGLSMIGSFLSWVYPPSDFGGSFLEGGMIWVVFGTETGRNIIYVISTIVTGIMCSFIMLAVMMRTHPQFSKKILDVVAVVFVAIFGVWLLVLFLSHGIENSGIPLISGQLCGVIAFWYMLRVRENAFDE